ncbi:MAG: MurR/RpiR family transcriptional regulator [Halanaerobiales bacterium]|nr:MurR/RpiR family transcriptional regulator [Halanaerobiales bacterium]
MNEYNKRVKERIDNEDIRINTLMRLKTGLDSIRVSEQKVVNYVLLYPFKVIEMTIGELAKASVSSEATVVRTCKNLGFNGFQDLKFSLKRDIEDALSRVYEEVKPDDTSVDILGKVFKANAEALDNTFRTLDYSSFNSALEALKKANKIGIFGQGGAAAVALDTYHNFLNLGKDCFYNSDPNMQVIYAKSLKKGDVCLGISRSGEMREVIQSLQLAKEGGAFCIGITGTTGSVLTRITDIILYTNSSNKIFRNIDTAERIAELTILDALYIGLANVDLEKTKKALRASIEATSLNRITNNVKQ